MFVTLSCVSYGCCDIHSAVATLCCLQTYLLVSRDLHPHLNSGCLQRACKMKPSAVRGQMIAAVAGCVFGALALGGLSIVLWRSFENGLWFSG